MKEVKRERKRLIIVSDLWGLQDADWSIDVLGFSVGGYIAWRAAREGFKVNSLTAVSSTRLRYENSQPHCAVNLLYGENDPYKPESEWFNRFDLNKKIYREEDHRFYTKKEIALAVCREIINKEGRTAKRI